MKQKILSFCAEYLLFAAAGVVVVFISEQGSLFNCLVMLSALTITILLLWCFGWLLKYTIRKNRPEGRDITVTYRDKYAFPSMHALTLGASTLYVYIYNFPLGVIMLVLSSVVIYARVRTRMHYIVDVIVGFCFGLLCAYYVTPFLENYCASLLSPFFGS